VLEHGLRCTLKMNTITSPTLTWLTFHETTHSTNFQVLAQHMMHDISTLRNKKKKQSVKANQIYAKIFAAHTTNAHYGYYDFKVNSDEEWQSLLSSTADNETKAL